MANQPKKYKKFVATAATATLVASAIVPVASAAEFKDVAGNTHAEAINALADQGIINGYADGTFKPNQTINRGQVVKLLGRWLEAQGQEVPSDWKTEQRFNDLPVTAEEELVKYAALAKDAGVFNGSNGNLNYTQSMQRQQMAVVLVRAINEIAGVDLIAAYKDADFDSEISDLDKAYSAEQRNAIVALEYAGITQVSNFKPADSITRGQFASFLYRTMNMELEETTDASVKAINNTTVEVTFEEEVEDVKALDFAIEGLEISNAVVKQTNKKVVVLTTSAQTADTEYTVTLDGEKIGSFKGLSAVIPTKVELVSSSVQGKLGQQVSVQAKVTVAEGQSKAGIPVTFSIPGDNNDAVHPTVVGEAITNAEGVATYTYTRYGDRRDTVTAYATGDRSKFAIGYVFWGVDTILAITEVTEGSTINNGANKTYKIAYKDPETGKPVSNQQFNVGFLENMNVTSDKVADASVNGVKALQLNNNTAPQAATITTDSKGEATFTVSGTNSAVTPVVYALNNTAGENTKTYKASALQATTAKVTFGAVQAEYKIELTREGGEVAAIGAANGREYKIVVKDKDGKVAKNEVVNVAFNEDLDRVISTNTKARFVDADNDVYYTSQFVDGMSESQISVKTNDKGEATFVISSEIKNDYATPVAWIDINTSDAKQGKLDEGEPKTVAPISYFQEAYLDGSAIKSYKSTDLKKAVTKFDGGDTAVFAAELVNQSGKKIANIPVKKVTYTIFNTGANEIEVDGQIISPNRSLTVTEEATFASNGNVITPAKNLVITSKDGKTTSVRVIATGVAVNTDGKDYAFTSKEATATFTSTEEVGNHYTGLVEAINTSKEELKFVNKKAVSIKDAKFFGSNGAELADFKAFETELRAAVDTSTGKGSVVATYQKDSDDKVTVKIVRVDANAAAIQFDEYRANLSSAKVTVAGVTTTPATATVDSTTITATDGNTIVVDGVTFTYSSIAQASEPLFFRTLADLVYKINLNSNVKVKAEVDGTDLKLSAVKDGTFDYTVNGVKSTSTSGSVGKEQQVTLTFSSALNIAADDTITVTTSAGTALGTVGSVTNGKKTLVVKFQAASGLTVGSTITSVVVTKTDKGNTIAVPTTVTVTN